MTVFSTLSYTSVKSQPSHILEVWKWYPFRLEPPRKGNFGEYPSGFKTALNSCIKSMSNMSNVIKQNRVLKWWRHKNEISEIMGFVKIFWKNNVQEAYLLKMSIWGQIVSEIVAQLYSENSIQTLLIFSWVDFSFADSSGNTACRIVLCRSNAVIQI